LWKQSRVMGEQMARTPDVRKAIIDTYRKLTGRMPQNKEVTLLVQLQQISLAKFKQHPQKAKGILKAGQYQVDKKMDTSLIAANAVVANTILNSDATLTKR